MSKRNLSAIRTLQRTRTKRRVFPLLPREIEPRRAAKIQCSNRRYGLSASLASHGPSTGRLDETLSSKAGRGGGECSGAVRIACGSRLGKAVHVVGYAGERRGGPRH